MVHWRFPGIAKRPVPLCGKISIPLVLPFSHLVRRIREPLTARLKRLIVISKPTLRYRHQGLELTVPWAHGCEPSSMLIDWTDPFATAKPDARLIKLLVAADLRC